MNSFTTWLRKIGDRVRSWWYSEEKEILDFFAPLMEQVRDAALQVGKDNLKAGLEVLKASAIAGVTAAANAPEGSDKVKIAEETFLRVAKASGIEVIHNAEAGIIKAAVAIIQTATPDSIDPTVETVGEIIARQLGTTITPSNK